MAPLSLENLKINDKNIDYSEDNDLIDITTELFDSLVSITDNKVVKVPQFELLEGTRALEVLNTRLDTGLIELTPEELEFDCSQPQPINVIINIQTKLLSNLINWLESDSLPVTVLSCRYVQTILVNYLNHDTFTVGQFSFYDSRLPETNHDTSSLDYLLVHKVLKTFIMGLSKFIGFTIYLSRTVLYEEEDLTTKSMNLNFFQELLPQFFIDEINDCIEWIISHDDILEADVLITQLKIVSNLVRLEKTLATSPSDIQLTKKEEQPQHYGFCKEGIEQVNKLRKVKFDESVIPNGTFSKFIQVDLENKNIPAKLGHIDLETTWTHLSGIFETILRFTNQAYSIKTINQMLDFLQYNIKYPIEKFSVFTRGIFQLFFIRDDKSIFGSLEMTLPTLMIDIIENLVGKNTIVLGNFESSLSQLKDNVKCEVLERYNVALQDLESGAYHILTSYASNPCRLQQLLSKGLILWDTLQVAWESFEYELHKNFGIGDEFPSGDLSITVTSYIYYSKMKFMVDLLLNGIPLEIYKPFEIYLVYWYADYLILNIVEHVHSRVSQIIMGKINYIETNIPKKIKKLKAGPKKEQLKQQHKHNQEVIIPQLTATLNYNQDYLVKSFQLLQILIQCHSNYLAVLSMLQIIDFTKGPSNNLTTMENLYYLRMKPWSSIGIPNFPTFQQYQAKLKSSTFPGQNNKQTLMKALELLANIKNNLKGVEKEYNGLIGYIQRDTRDNFLKDSLVTTWYEELILTIGQLNENISQISKIISSNKDDLNLKDKYKLNIAKSHHMYFPNITVEPK